MMYNVKEEVFDDLQSAMNYAKTLNEFVTIKGPNFEIVGKFGVDEVVDVKNYNGWISRRKK